MDDFEFNDLKKSFCVFTAQYKSPNWDRTKINPEKQRRILQQRPVVANKPKTHQFSINDVQREKLMSWPAETKKDIPQDRGENFINHRGLNLDLFG